jgi:transcriptional regulator with XRE-family HTH domain
MEQGLSLYDVEARTRGRFKPSALGGYERGERAISLSRFCDLAAIYGTPPDRLLADAMRSIDPDGRQEVVIDLNRLSQLSAEEVGAVAEFIHKIKTDRHDYLSDVITLRAGDVEALALAHQVDTKVLLRRLRPAMAGSRMPPPTPFSPED